MKVYYDKDADLSLIKGKKVTIIGYGSQGHAHAQNLTDSGVKVTVGLRPGGASWDKVKKAKIAVKEVGEAVKGADVVMILVPDEHQAALYRDVVEPNIKKGAALAFAHGFNIHFEQIVPRADLDVIMIAPKGPGHKLREQYVNGMGIPNLIAVHQNPSRQAKQVALAYSKALGGTRAGVLETTFAEETETDLFGEQVILCGGLSALIEASFETLVKAGYQPEIAYYEVCHELQLIINLIIEGGLSWMRYSVSDTAEYGDYTRGPRVINAQTRKELKKILREIQNGSFAKEWIKEWQTGAKNFKAMRKKNRNQPIEIVGPKLRKMMTWMKPKAVPKGE